MSEEKKIIELNDDELDKVVGGVDEGCDREIASKIKMCEALIIKYTALLETPGISEKQKREYESIISKAEADMFFLKNK